MGRLMTTPPLLMIPGPTPVAPEVLAALAEPVRSHTGPENAATLLHMSIAIATLAIILGRRWPWVSSLVLAAAGVALAAWVYI